ncbi:RNA exonuclease 4 [Lamellibrachia satsuma]|nr:RNA exonuclease 4 [Lamellibrachia satsuma]
MKRTHQDKVKRKKKKHKSHKPVAVKLPEAPGEISANWKNLLKTLTTTKKAEKRPLAQPHKQTTQKSPAEKTESEPAPTAPDIWFDDVDDIFIEKAKPTKDEKPSDKLNPLVRPNSFEGLTKAVAMDCEMVGVGSDGQDSILARVSIVNQFGQCIYDTFVKPTELVTDYRTHVSGVRRQDIAKAPAFETVQKKVSDILKARVLVGHALHNDLKILFLDHPRKKIRDTARYKPYRSLFNGGNPSLKKLTEKVLGVKVQEGEHSSVQDAQAAMRLYTYQKKKWEKDIASRFKRKFKKTPKAADKQNNGTAITD